MALPYVLMAAQAIGLGLELYGQRQERRMAKLGRRIERDELNLRMEQERLASSEESLRSLEDLREVMAYQRAYYGATGANPGAGSAKAIEQKQLRAFGADERARELNLKFSQANLLSKQKLLTIQKATQNMKMGAELFQSSFNRLGINDLFGNLGLQDRFRTSASNVPQGRGQMQFANLLARGGK